MVLLKIGKECKSLKTISKVLCNLVYTSLLLSVFSILTLAYFNIDRLHVIFGTLWVKRIEVLKVSHRKSLSPVASCIFD